MASGKRESRESPHIPLAPFAPLRFPSFALLRIHPEFAMQQSRPLAYNGGGETRFNDGKRA